MAVNSKQKGSRVERQACKLVEDLIDGAEYRRSQQYSGERTDDTSADIIGNIDVVRFEVKGGYNDAEFQSKVVQEWIATAKEETPDGQHWCILWKKDYKEWVIITEVCGFNILTNEIAQIITMIMEQYEYNIG